MSFHTYENWRAGAHKAVIHDSSCSFCNHRRGLRTEIPIRQTGGGSARTPPSLKRDVSSNGSESTSKMSIAAFPNE